MVTEAQGWRLHLSSRSSTGYAGVRKQEQASGSRGRRPPWASGRFTAYHTVDGRQIFIGFFDSAVEAAVAYARAEGSVDGQVARGRAAVEERRWWRWRQRRGGGQSGAALCSSSPGAPVDI